MKLRDNTPDNHPGRPIPAAVTPSDRVQADRAENEGLAAAPTRTRAATRPAKGQAETTSLERRVLAHERVLQSLIAHMAETDQRYLDRMRAVFSDTMKMARHEQDFTDTDDFAEEFIRGVEALSKRNKDHAPAPPDAPATAMHDADSGPRASAPAAPPRFLVRERNGVWEVTEDGRFIGDYVKEEDARAAAAEGKRAWEAS